MTSLCRLCLIVGAAAAAGQAKPSITTTSLPEGVVGVAYFATVVASGGPRPFTWSTVNGSLPAGLAITADGDITGTPTAAGTSAFTVQARDSNGEVDTRDLQITIRPALSVATTSLPTGTTGSLYVQVLSANGGLPPFQWTLASGSLPAGLDLGANGMLAGTPSTAGSFSFTVRVTDSRSASATQALTLMVVGPLAITTDSLAPGAIGNAYSQVLAANGGAGGYIWSTTGGSLPAGLSLSASGTISGMPTAAGASSFTVQVVDASNASATRLLSITIASTPLTVSTSTLPGGTVGVAYQQSLAASGGTGGYTWSTTAGSLPAGLSLSASGTIAGTPTAPGTSSFTVQVRDNSNATATTALSITIAPPPLTVTTSTLPDGTVGVAYQQSLAATGGTGGYTWSTTAGSLPAGLSLSANGAIAGTPTAPGAASFTVEVRDNSNATATRALGITIAPPPLTVTTSTLPDGTVGVTYQQSLAASGGTGGYTWSTTAGSLPAGLSLSASGEISGAPTALGASSFAVQVRDNSNATATRPLSITIAPAQLTVTTSTLPDGAVGTPYQQSLSASGGTGGYAWSTTAGSLPAGLSLSAGGIIAGTPTAPGVASFTVQARDSSNATAAKPLSITIAPPQLTITTSALPDGTVGTPYQQSLSASGGTGGYAWSTTAGSLPAGLSLSASGAIAGTPTAPGVASFTVQARDNSNATATKPLSITIAPPQLTITTSALPDGTAGVSYQQSLSASGGTGGYTWSTTAGSLPAGLSLSANGTIAGTPIVLGTATFTVQVRDSSNATVTKAFSLAVAPPQLRVVSSSLPGGVVGVPYTQTLSATGGTGTYSWSVTSGALPAGLALSLSGIIGGAPTAPGSFTLTVTVTDGTSSAARGFTITVEPPVAITTFSLPSGIVGTAYGATLTATGAAGPASWTVIAGQLPQGLTLNAATGRISGTPATAGNFTFGVELTDSRSGGSASATLTITINRALSITTAPTLATGSAGASYSQSFTAAGGVPPYVWSVTGALPVGLALSPAGVLTGTPTQVGSFPITVQVSDAASKSVTASYSLQVVSGLAIATPPVLPLATVGTPYSLTLQPAGGSPPYSWVATAGSLPGGLNLSGAGQISGTATSTGDFSFTVQVTDANSNSVRKTFTLTVAGPLSITSAALPAGSSGVPYAQNLVAAGGTPPYLWSVSAGALPDGITLHPQTGAVAGTPTASGNFTFTAVATDANSVAAQRQFTVSIGAGLALTSTGSLPGATAGAAYEFQLQASGGRPPYSWSVQQGSLPAGLSLNGVSGVIGGVPAEAGTFNFAIQVSDSGNLTATRGHTLVVGLPALPALSITGLPVNLQPLQQPLLDVSLERPYPVPITGTVALSFVPAGPNPMDDPSVQFSTGGRSATFTIPANATTAIFGIPQFGIQSGSVAGSITLSIVSLRAAGASVEPPSPPGQAATVMAGPPAIRTLSLVRTPDGFQLQILGLTSTRELTQASVTFQPVPGTSLQSTQLTVALSGVAGTWFQSAASARYGGQFNLTLPFTFQGTVSLSSVSVVLSNSRGDSQASSAMY